MLLLSVAALTPAALRVLAQAAARLGARASPVARLACGDIAASLSRTGVASAALGMALTAMIGVAIMVESFRESLREWLIQTLRADVYVSAPGPAEASERRLDPAVIRALLATAGIRDHSESRRVVVGSERGALDLNAVRFAHASYPALRFTQAARGSRLSYPKRVSASRDCCRQWSRPRPSRSESRRSPFSRWRTTWPPGS